MIDSSLIEKAESSSLRFERSIVVAIRARSFLVCLVDLFCLKETSHSLFVIFPVDVAESEHVVDDDEVVVEGVNLLRGKLSQSCQCCLVAFERITQLLHIVVEFSQQAVRDELVPACRTQQSFQHLNRFVFVHERSFLGRRRAR